MKFEFVRSQISAMEVIPEGALITANAVLVVLLKQFVTIITVFLYTCQTPPWFVGIFFVEFDSVII